MLSPFSGKDVDKVLVRKILDLYKKRKLFLVFYPDKPFIKEVIVEYSFNGWKTFDQEKLEWDEKRYFFYAVIDIPGEEIFYRFRIRDNYGGERYINNKGENYYQKLPSLKINFVSEISSKIAEDLAAGKILFVACGKAAFTPWSLGDRGIIVDLRNDRIKNLSYKVGDDILSPRVIAFLDRLDEYIYPPLPSLYGDMSGYLKRDAHPYLLPFVEEENYLYFYGTLKRSEDLLQIEILEEFERRTGHPLLWVANREAEGEKLEGELEVFFYFLNSIWIDKLYLGEVSIEKDG